jgi:hypothetical protein
MKIIPWLLLPFLIVPVLLVRPGLEPGVTESAPQVQVPGRVRPAAVTSPARPSTPPASEPRRPRRP